MFTGSAEGFNKADKDINTAVKSGRWVKLPTGPCSGVLESWIVWSDRWVMLENVHLAPGWLMQLEKKLHSMQPHASFRLFLTMEINPKVNQITLKKNNSNISYLKNNTLKSHQCVFPPGSSESTSCWSHLCVWTSSWCQGQHAQNLHQHSCGPHVQGDIIWNNKTFSHLVTKCLSLPSVLMHTHLLS